MPIEVRCACGRKSSVADEHAGKKAKCPACGVVTTVPDPDDDLVASLKRATPPIPAGPPVIPPIAVPTLAPSIQKVYLVDANLPFGSMVVLAIKWAFASVPAVFLIGLFWGLVYLIAAQVLLELGAKR
jgi:hypothetical protein